MSAAIATLGTGRSIGLRSVFLKTLRDSRRSFVIATIFLGGVTLTGGAAMATAFATIEGRHEAELLATTMPPVIQSMLGRPIGLTHLGGFIEWRVYAVFVFFLPIWSILALSSTLAAEADRGSLDLLATTRLARRRIAIEKVLGHLVVVTAAMAITFVVLLATGSLFATLPGDEIPADAAFGFVALSWLMVVVPGAIAFAVAPIVGRGAAAGLAAVALVTAYSIQGYRTAIPALDALAPLSWFSWTANHVPLAGVFDWGSLVGLAAVIVVLLVLGVIAFERRDVGITARVPAPRLPTFLVGLRGPLGRSFGERLPIASAWAIGMFLYVFALTSAVPAMQDLFAASPNLEQLLRLVYPDIDITTFAGMLQVVFVDFGLIVIGIAAATLVAGWASDEASGRLEVLLSTPLTRAGWLVRSGLGVYLAIVLIVAGISAAAGVGAAVLGNDPWPAASGSFVMALYGTALAGIGIAIGGLIRPSLASATILAITILSFLLVILATALELPDWVADLALSAHYGQPMIGAWDVSGVVASFVLAFGGLLVGAWGLSRRDVRA